MKFTQATPVTVSLHDLQSNSIPFPTLLSAFGPDSLGILVVTDLPSSFPPLRRRVLSNASRIAHLPTSTLQSLTKPSAKYLVGWSHGVETLRPGVVDTAKGSYYINCAFYKDAALNGADGTKFPGFEEYTAPNVWPPEDVQTEESGVPDFKHDAEELINLIIDTAVLVARACDRFAESEIDAYEKGYLERMVRDSETTKARLLHYFPTETQTGTETDTSQTNGSANGATTGFANGDRAEEEDNEIDDSWCTTHLDHGCLTGLTSAMFLDETVSSQLDELPSSPNPSSGLYILSRSQKIHKVAIPRGALAFQTGEALELITDGRFKAVPHFVRGVDSSSVEGKRGIARNTLAVFTQPNLDEVVDLQTGLTFGEFARGVVKKNTAG